MIHNFLCLNSPKKKLKKNSLKGVYYDYTTLYNISINIIKISKIKRMLKLKIKSVI